MRIAKICLARIIGEAAMLTIKTGGSGCPIFAPVEGAAAPLVRKPYHHEHRSISPEG
jgi:hypothetical protein